VAGRWKRAAAINVVIRIATRIAPKMGTFVWIKWIGSHKDYDRIDVTEVEHGE
jgi:mRNA-degrading endonuclease HigB of HigAB toxin-antitoxin module